MSDVMDPQDTTPLLECRDALHQAAADAVGHDDFGPDEYREGLHVFLRACDEEAQLTGHGRVHAKSRVLAGLKGRLHSQAGFAAHPEHRQMQIQRPLLIVGMPRTASTALHRMLARDPGLQGLELWLAESPMPRPPREQWPQIPAFVECDAATRALFESAPEMRAIHEIDADDVDECWHLAQQSFGSTLECSFWIPSYSRWWAACDMRPAFRRYRQNLALIGHREPERRWLLKDATHMFHLDAFLEVFPDACVVTTHRDPVKLIPSVCSLTATFRAGMERAFDPHAHGRAQLALWARGQHKIHQVRDATAPERWYEMSFEAFQADPHAEVRRIYEHFGFELSSPAEAAMQDWRRTHRKGQHGAHRYMPEDFGLTPDQIRAAFD